MATASKSRRKATTSKKQEPKSSFVSHGKLKKKLYGVQVYTPLQWNPNSPELHVDLENNLLDKGKRKRLDRLLFVSLVKQWWDMTHMFHFDEIEEMMMTPMDFSAIIGLRVSNNPLKHNINVHQKRKQLEKQFGKQVSHRVYMKRIRYDNLSTTYWYKESASENEVDDQITRVFILCLLA
ncbi:hypothetical protein GBA52_026140 [Prunus armeniaca]|nr:hypothetical protein GBA52_026140 [Prunus armeniaca]